MMGRGGEPVRGVPAVELSSDGGSGSTRLGVVRGDPVGSSPPYWAPQPRGEPNMFGNCARKVPAIPGSM